jgi:two-component system response regulator RegX3
MDGFDLQGVRILVVDDHPSLCELLEHVLTKEGADVSVALTGEEALELFPNVEPDVVILDIMMPGMSGLEVCTEMLRVANVPVILLTALGGEDATVRGLACGAIDYVTKPFSVRVLLARVQAAVRRRSLPPGPSVPPPYDDGYLHVDFQRHQVLVGGEPVKLTPIEQHLLEHLVRHADRLVPLEELLTEVWGSDYSDSRNYVHVYVSRLRSKLEGHPEVHIYLRNERGAGYRFVRRQTLRVF